MAKFPTVSFTDVLIYKKNHVFISAVSDELADKNIDHAAIFRWLDGQWAQKTTDVAVRGMIALETDKVSLINMGINGKIIEFTFPGERVEYVDQSSNGPNDLLHLRAIRQIGSHIFVAGMGRRVYRRDAANQWTAIDTGVFVKRADRKKSVGFNAIDGTDIDDIYAVGYSGEIWHFNGADWTEEETPTNLALNAVRIARNKDVYVAGMAGTIIRRRNEAWEVIDQDISTKDFWGIAIFDDNIYFSNYEGVFKLDVDTIIKVDMGINAPITTAYLDANDGVLWSVGENDLVYTSDGVTWTQIQFN